MEDVGEERMKLEKDRGANNTRETRRKTEAILEKDGDGWNRTKKQKEDDG